MALPLNRSTATNPILAPQRTGIATALQSVRQSGVLPKYEEINYRPVTAQKVSGVGDALGNDYFDSLEQQASRKLNERYFGGPDSLARQQQQLYNKRGLIGSGIESAGNNQLLKTFGDDLVDLQTDFGRQRAEQRQNIAFKNKDIELENVRSANEIARDNARQTLEASQKNRDFRGFLSELGLRAAADEARTATDFDTKTFEQQVGVRGDEQQFLGDILGQLNTALGNEKLDVDTRNRMRDLFNDLLGITKNTNNGNVNVTK